MGNKSSATRLSDRDAWNAATTWNKKLVDIVQFERQWVDGYGYVTWVHFEFDHSPTKTQDSGRVVKAARDAAIIWAALSRCPGFGFDENPTFWKRVAANLHHRENEPASSEHRFAPVQTSLPCVRINSNWQNEKRILRIFLAKRPSRRARALVARLQRFTSPNQRDLSVPIAVTSSQADMYRAIQEWSRSRRKHEAHFEVRTVSLEVADREGNESLATLWSFLRLRIEIPHLLSSSVTKQRRNLLRRMLNSRERTIRIQSMCLTCDYAEWCSALPFAPTLTTLFLSELGGPQPLFDGANAAWLGYALFASGPTTFSSPISDLEVLTSQLGPSTLQVLELMAKGINLLFAMGLSSEVTTGYHYARLRAGSRVAGLGDDTDVDTIDDYNSDRWVTLCESAGALDPTKDRIVVVIPGRGLGWIRPEAIVERVTRKSTSCSLRRLRVIAASAQRDQDTAERITALLVLVGEKLTHLDATSDAMFSALSVQSVLSACPSLESLSIAHDGSFWSGEPQEPNLRCNPRLRELELQLVDDAYEEASLRMLTSSQLNDLKCFRLVSARIDAYHIYVNEATFLAILARYPRLRVASWANSCKRQNSVLSSENRMLSGRRNGHLLGGFVSGVHDPAQAPLSIRMRLAFLSCVRHYAIRNCQQTSSIGKLAPELAGHIFAFSSMTVPRIIGVEYPWYSI